MRILRLLAILGVFWTHSAQACPEHESTSLSIHSKGTIHPFEVELADTPETQSKGLMHRTRLDADKGMLFVFGTPGKRIMWMRDTLIPLDMLFVDEKGRIVHIHENAEPHSTAPISADAPASAVLELPGGTARKLGIATGDRIDHPIFKAAP